MQRKRKWWFAAMLTPTLLVFALVFAYPTWVVIASSFTDWRLIGERTYIGWENYRNIFTKDRDFVTALTNTVTWIILEGTVHVSLGVIMALIIYKRPKGWKLLRTAYYMPNVVATSAMAMLFTNIYSPNYGILNGIIRMVTRNPNFSQNWLNDPKTAFLSVTLCWIMYAGLVMIIVYTDIMSIDNSVLEAARIDGASQGQIDRLVVLPLVRNSIVTCVIIASTSKLKEFEMIYLTTKGGPLNLTTNLPLLVYKYAMVSGNYGYANTYGTLLILLGLMIVVIQSVVLKLGSDDR